MCMLYKADVCFLCRLLMHAKREAAHGDFPRESYSFSVGAESVKVTLEVGAL